MVCIMVRVDSPLQTISTRDCSSRERKTATGRSSTPKLE